MTIASPEGKLALTLLCGLGSTAVGLIALVCALYPISSIHAFSHDHQVSSSGRINNPLTRDSIYLLQVPYVLGALAVAGKLMFNGSSMEVSAQHLWAKKAVRVTRQGLVLLRREIAAPSWLVRAGFPDHLEIKDVLVFSLFLAFNWCLLAQWMYDYLQYGEAFAQYLKRGHIRPRPAPQGFWTWGSAEKLAIMTGYSATFMLGWYLVLPTSRRSVFLDMLGLSWETAIKYHRWIGWHATFLTIMHILLYIAVWMYATCHPDFDKGCSMLRHNLYIWGCGDCDEDEWETNLFIFFGWLAFILMLLMVVFSLSVVRRRCYKVFYIVHLLWMPMLVLVHIHWPNAVYLFVPGIAVHSVDKTLAAFAHLGGRRAQLRQLCSDLVEIIIPSGTSFACQPGQYVMLNIPLLSAFQWHPFTVTWTGPREFALHVKVGGSWTAALRNAIAEQGEDDLQSVVRVHGFYGKDLLSTEFWGKDALLLWAGGVGITCLFSVAMEAVKRGLKVYLRWVVRTESEQHVMTPLLRALDSTSIKVWVTTPQHFRQDTALEERVQTATMPTPVRCPLSDNKHSEPERVPVMLLSAPMHAVVSAIAMLAGFKAVLVVRDMKYTYESQWWAYLFQVLAPFLSSMAVALMAVALALSPWSCVVQPIAKRRAAVDSADSCREIDHLSENWAVTSEVHDNSSLEVVLGTRPDVAAEFNLLESELPPGARDIGVLVCGPCSLMHLVQKECENRMLQLRCWQVRAEPWEW